MGGFRSMLLPLLVLLAVTSCKTEQTINGYIAAHTTVLSVPSAGKLLKLNVHEGQSFKAGQLLFVVDSKHEQFLSDIAQAKITAELEKLKDMKIGKRTAYLKILQANIEEAKHALIYANKTYKRMKRLKKTHSIAAQQYDESQAQYLQKKSAVDALIAELNYAKLPARPALQQAQLATLNAARQDRQQQLWFIKQKSVVAKESGVVLKVFYDPEEYVGPNHPIMNILHPGKRYIEFYADKKQLGQLKVGDVISAKCAGCSHWQTTKITLISPNTAYTPQFLFSGHASGQITLKIQTSVPRTTNTFWHPGQPVQIKLRQ